MANWRHLIDGRFRLAAFASLLAASAIGAVALLAPASGDDGPAAADILREALPEGFHIAGEGKCRVRIHQVAYSANQCRNDLEVHEVYKIIDLAEVSAIRTIGNDQISGLRLDLTETAADAREDAQRKHAPIDPRGIVFGGEIPDHPDPALALINDRQVVSRQGSVVCGYDFVSIIDPSTERVRLRPGLAASETRALERQLKRAQRACVEQSEDEQDRDLR